MRAIGLWFKESSPAMTQQNFAQPECQTSAALWCRCFQHPVPHQAQSGRAGLSRVPGYWKGCFNLDAHFTKTADGRKTVGTASENVVISVVPSAIAPNMMERWEIDLSPGIVTSPFKPLCWLDF